MKEFILIISGFFALCAVIVNAVKKHNSNIKPGDKKAKNTASYNRKHSLIKEHQRDVDIADARFWANK